MLRIENMKTSLSVVVLLVSVGFISAEERMPNILVILADDLGYGDIGVHGCKDIPTPNIDKLAATGVRCTNGYSSHPFCSPMRAGFIVGRYQHRFGYERNIAYDPHNKHMGLPTSETTFAKRLQKKNYHTGILGKWHLGASAPFHPNRRGFNHFYGFLGGGHDYFDVDLTRPIGEGYRVPLQRNGKPTNLDEYLTTALSKEAVRFVESSKDKPFFLYVSYNAPHTPMQAPQETLDKFSSIKNKKRRAYAAMVHIMDEGIGQILQTLNRLNLRDNTLIFFLSDNGGPEMANASNNGPLRGQKGHVYEGGIRVPFLVSWPGVLPEGKEYHQPVSSLDIATTALETAVVPVTKEAKLDGINLIPYLAGKRKESPHGALFWRKENGKAWAVRAGSLKLLKVESSPKMLLYDLSKDIGETNDLTKAQPEDVKRLKALYDQWNKANTPPFFPSFRDYHRLMDKHYRSFSVPQRSNKE